MSHISTSEKTILKPSFFCSPYGPSDGFTKLSAPKKVGHEPPKHHWLYPKKVATALVSPWRAVPKETQVGLGWGSDVISGGPKEMTPFPGVKKNQAIF